jgi:hypothetical protein
MDRTIFKKQIFCDQNKRYPLSRQPGQTAKSFLFADDLADIFIFKTVGPRIENHINDRLAELEYWLKLWRLYIAASKFNYMLFSNNKRTGASDELYLDSALLPKKTIFKRKVYFALLATLFPCM